MDKFISTLILVCIGIISCNSRNSDDSGTHEVWNSNEANDIVASDSLPIAFRPVIEAFSPANNENVNNASYFLYDLTCDGTPELWVSSGTCEADTRLTAYSTDNGSLRKIYDGDGGSSDFFVTDGKLICVMCNTGAGFVITYRYEDGTVTDNAVEFSTWNEDGKAQSKDSLTNKILEYWERNNDRYIKLTPIK